MADVEDYSTTAASNTADFPEGQAPSTVNNGGREVQADVAAMYQRTNAIITATGTADALIGTFSPTHTADVAGRIVVIQAASTNTSATPTFQLDSLTARTITKNGTSALVADDIQADAFLIFKYDLVNTVWELLNPAIVAATILPTLTNAITSDELTALSVGNSELKKIGTTGTQGLASTATWLIPAGFYSMSADQSGVHLENLISGTWYGNAAGNVNGYVWADGTNMRIKNDNGSATTVYYRKLD